MCFSHNLVIVIVIVIVFFNESTFTYLTELQRIFFGASSDMSSISKIIR